MLLIDWLPHPILVGRSAAFISQQFANGLRICGSIAMDMNDLVIISVDDHVSEPRDMFDRHLSPANLATAPKFRTSAKGTNFWEYQGIKLPSIGLGAVVGRPFEVSAGHVTVPDAPGWGVEISPAWLDRATYTEAALDSFKPSAYGALYHKAGKP